MRKKRQNIPNRCYHLYSRIAHKALFFDDEEKGRFVNLLYRVAQFCGVKVLGYGFMSNHIHIYIYLPEEQPVDEAELLKRIQGLYCKERLAEVMDKWNRLKALAETSQSALAASGLTDFDEYKRSFVARMYNVSEFAKAFKQHYTLSFNSRYNHVGTLWETRCHMRITKPVRKDMSSILAYIDCNPVAGGIVNWPSKYRWCSFAAAVSGRSLEQAGYRFVYGDSSDWGEILELHNAAIRKRIGEIQEEKVSEKIKAAKRRSDWRKRRDEEDKKELDVESPERREIQLEKGDCGTALRILGALSGGELNAAEICASLDIRCREFVAKTYLKPLLGMGYIERTLPDCPKSPNQKYRLTRKGLALAA